MKRIILTGGIGSGKSTVCRILEDNGALTYDADSVVKSLYETVPGLLDQIEKVLGLTLRDDRGCFCPRILADRIFSDDDALAKVEELVFPYLVDDFERFCRNNEEHAGWVVLESATILEKPAFNGLADIVIVVDAPLSLRLERACSRDGADVESIRRRMDRQRLMNEISSGYVDPRVDIYIRNEGTLSQLEDEVRNVIDTLNLN